MSTINQPLKCSGCQNDNQPGMSFCMNCGLPLNLSPMATSSDGKICRACGKTSDLTVRFCIFCGSDTVEPGIAVEPPATAPVAYPYKSTDQITMPLHARDSRRIVRLAVSLIAGCAAGLTAGWLSLGWWQQQVVKSIWPHRGLVMYVLPAQCQVTLQESGGASFTIGRTGPSGALSIPDLAPGDYEVAFSSPGYKAAGQSIKVERDKLAVLGFPEPLQLER